MKKRTPHWVSVRDYENVQWVRRIFVGVEDDGRYCCVIGGDEKDYVDGFGYRTLSWNYMKEREQLKLFGQKFFLDEL